MSTFRIFEHRVAARHPVAQSSSFFWFWRCASGSWRGPSTRAIWALTALLVVIVLLELPTQYRLNIWNRDFFNALERKDGAAIGQQALMFVPFALAGVALAILGVWGA
jgi:vitamin B12/bleomycin/antimicrobial peptide transport system ATP-binding/permease protein